MTTGMCLHRMRCRRSDGTRWRVAFGWAELANYSTCWDRTRGEVLHCYLIWCDNMEDDEEASCNGKIVGAYEWPVGYVGAWRRVRILICPDGGNRNGAIIAT